MEAEKVTSLVKEKVKGKSRIAIVRALFRNDMTTRMEETARKHASFLGAEVVSVHLVRGTLEIPLAAKKLLEKKEVEGVVVLGAVIKGSTKHDEVVVENATRALVGLSLKTNKPVGIGIIGPGVSLEQAEKRIDEYSKGAVEAAVLSVESLKEVG